MEKHLNIGNMMDFIVILLYSFFIFLGLIVFIWKPSDTNGVIILVALAMVIAVSFTAFFFHATDVED